MQSWLISSTTININQVQLHPSILSCRLWPLPLNAAPSTALDPFFLLCLLSTLSSRCMGGNGPQILDTDIALSRIGSRRKGKRGSNNTVANPDTVSKRSCLHLDLGADIDPITSVDGPNDVHEDVNDAKSKASTTGMDKVRASTAQSDTGLEKAHSTNNTVTELSTIVMNKVWVDLNDDNDVVIAADGVNDDDEDVKDKDKLSTINDHNNDVNENGVSKVRLYWHRLRLSPPWLLSWFEPMFLYVLLWLNLLLYLISLYIIPSFNIVIFVLIIGLRLAIFPHPILPSHQHTPILSFVIHIYYRWYHT